MFRLTVRKPSESRVRVEFELELGCGRENKAVSACINEAKV